MLSLIHLILATLLLSRTDFVYTFRGVLRHQGFWEEKKPGRGKGGKREMLNSKLELESNKSVPFSVMA